MDDDRPQESGPSGTASGEQEKASAEQTADDPTDLRAWSNLWQVPTILISLLLIALAIRMAVNNTPEDDFDAALAEVEYLLTNNELDLAGHLLREEIEPHIDRAEPAERGRYHAAVGDWTALVQRAERVDSSTNNLRIDRQYSLAESLDHPANAARLERWINALISLGRVEDARRRLADMEQLDVGSASPIRSTRIELFRQLITVAINRQDVPRDLILQWLREHRADERTSSSDQLWAAARQAEIRLDEGETRRAVDQLLIDMRRIEYAAEPGARLDVAELYVMLGRGYNELGDDTNAMRYLDRALERLDNFGHPSNTARGAALTLAAQIAMTQGQIETAYNHFDTVEREFVETRHYLPALLGRAEVSSILGMHDEAQTDFRKLVQILTDRGTRAGLSPRRVAASLVDRHDAALARGELKLALSYATIAERIFPQAEVPTDVLFRIAATSRQLADDTLKAAGGIERAEAAERHEANEMFEQAANYFVRHARSVTGLPTSDSDWADSLFQAADCFDLAGLHQYAVTHFEEYLAGRSVADPRRAEVTFRLAQCHHALMQYESAAHFYEQVIEEHPRSVMATQSHVPLARCYLALDRRPEAEQQLRQVLAGLHPVQPDAMDFRDALIELGTIYYNADRFVAAIEHLDQAVNRYPDDPRYPTVLFRLADSYRSQAKLLAERLEAPTPESPGEQRRLDTMRREHLRKALELFERVCAEFDGVMVDQLPVLKADLMRRAYMHRADSAYHLGEYERAITLYDEAARRFADHHSSMHALIQIVNCYSELGESGLAATAHRRALVRLNQLRDDAFDADDSMMDREAWERWLENSPVAPSRAASAAGS